MTMINMKQAGIAKLVSAPQFFRQSFATQLAERGYHKRTVRELLCHSRPNTSMVYSPRLDRSRPADVTTSFNDIPNQNLVYAPRFTSFVWARNLT